MSGDQTENSAYPTDKTIHQCFEAQALKTRLVDIEDALHYYHAMKAPGIKPCNVSTYEHSISDAYVEAFHYI